MEINRRRRFVLFAAVAPLLLSVALAATPTQAQQVTVTPTVTPSVAPATTPDRCEPNDTLVAPCALQTEIEQTDLNFVDNPMDVYSFLFKAGRVYVVSAASDSGIDPAIRVFLAGKTDTVVAENDDAGAGSTTATVQVAVPADGWYIIEVSNRAPGDMRGKTYRLSARSSMAAAAAPATTAAEQPSGDILENNYDVNHAARIAWAVPYDLSLQCPDPRPDACFAGDHDFLLVPVKKGVPFIAVTYDLGPGSDTVLTLYAPDSTPNSAPDAIPGWRPVMSNDDTAVGRTLRSQIMLTPTWSGDALLIVAESERRNPPIIPTALGPAGRYRLMVGSPSMDELQTVLHAQADMIATATPVPVSGGGGSGGSGATSGGGAGTGSATSAPVRATSAPEPTTVPTAAPASSAPEPASNGDAEEIIRETCTTGLAVVARADAPFYAAASPTSEKRLLMTYPQGTEVTLIGSCYIGWVKVQPSTSVTPGWMFAPDLELIEGAAAKTANPAATPAAGPQGAPGATATPQIGSAAARSSVLPVVRTVATPTAAPAAAPAQALSVTVRVVDAQDRGIAGVRVQIVSVYGTILNDVITGNDGQSTITLAVQKAQVLRVQLPAAGITVPLTSGSSSMTVTLPQGAEVS